jgi:hypothetical protein
MARDWKLIGILIGCGPQPSGTSPALVWSVIAVKLSRRRGGWQSGAAAGPLMKICQNVCQILMSEVQKDLEDVSAGIGIFV